MNFDNLQHLWNSPSNQLSAGQQRQLARGLVNQMRRRRRFQAFWLASTFAGLIVGTLIAARAIMTGKANLEEQWALFPLLILPWAFAIHFLRRFLNPPIPPARGELVVTESLQAALDSTRSEQSRLKAVGLLFAIFVPILAVSMRQLQAVGKVSHSELLSMAAVFGIALALSVAAMIARYVLRLSPQERRLSSLLSEFENRAD